MLVRITCGPVTRRVHEYKPDTAMRCDDGHKTAAEIVPGDRILGLGRVLAVETEAA